MEPERPRAGGSPPGSRVGSRSTARFPSLLFVGAVLGACLVLSPAALPGQEAGRETPDPAERPSAIPTGTSTLMGVVNSAETGRPVRDARVRVAGLPGVQLTGGKGNFRFEGLPEGSLRLTADYLGYRSDTVVVNLAPGSTTFVTLLLQTDPVPLPELRVEVERIVRNPRLAGFYERRQRGLGHYIGREDLERRDLISAFRLIPGVRVEQCIQPSPPGLATMRGIGQGDDPSLGGGGEGSDAGQGQRSTGSAMGPMVMRRAGCYELRVARGYGSAGFNARCVPEVWIDGHLISSFGAQASGESVFERVRNLPRHFIEGVEVYRNAAMAPVQYKTFGGCGIVLVWTRGR